MMMCFSGVFNAQYQDHGNRFNQHQVLQEDNVFRDNSINNQSTHHDKDTTFNNFAGAPGEPVSIDNQLIYLFLTAVMITGVIYYKKQTITVKK